MLTRRQVLQRATLFGVLGGVAPTLLWQAKVAKGSSAGQPALAPADRTLVIIQMAGGNDGLNTVVPYEDPTYMSVRPTLHVDPSAALPLTGGLGLNPVMGSLKSVWDAGKLAIIEGVGYPNPTYSHFDSMAIWQTAAPKGEFSDGWLGRYFRQTGAESNTLFAGIDVGGALAPMLRSKDVTVPVVESPAAYRLTLDPRDAEARLEAWQDLQTAAKARDRYLPAIGSAALGAYAGTQALASAVGSYQPAVTYGKDSLSGSLRLLASIIVEQPGTKIGYASIGGFDTHSNERKTQDNLLQTVSDALANFQTDLAAHGKADGVLVATWTEFGRRVRENGSQGTDHGDGNPMFLMGNAVKTDFRSVYATLLEQWLQIDSMSILGGNFATLPFLRG